jgi:replicative DNA helicase
LSKLILRNIETLEEKQGNRSLVTGVPMGFTLLDNMTSGLQNADLIILAGRPSMGKTALALNIARNAAVDANIPVAVFSLEMSKEQLSLRMLCAEARLDSSRLRGGYFSMEDWHRLTDSAGVLSESSIYIDDTPSLSAMEIRAKARRLKMDKNIGLVIIDYLQLMQGRSSAERRDLEISEISRSLKALAKELNLPVLALSQLNRMLEQRNDKRPKLSDLRESGALEQDADVVAFIYRDEIYNTDENNPKRGTAEIILAKQRNGPVGEVTLAFLNSYTRFENLAPEEMAESQY